MKRLLLLLPLIIGGCIRPSTTTTPEWQVKLEGFIRHEMTVKGIPTFSMTIVDGQDIAWSKGFGSVSDTTVYRVASVSKLFNAMAVMQLVEQGVLNLDAPITNYIPDFQPNNPFDKPTTLRQLLTHQSGLVREPPVGHYFDDTEPDLKATVASLNNTDIVLAPETTTKYSNAAVSVAGYAIEQAKGVRFEEHVQTMLIDKLGMGSTSFSPRPDLRARLGTGYMWRYDTDDLTEAPVFELGIGPAANLYTTTEDLGRFISMLFAITRNEHPEILSAASLQEMWTPQFVEDGTHHGFGLGFYVSHQDGLLHVGHAGVMYGYATRVWALPEESLGVAAVSNLDASNPVVDRISRYALTLLRAHREGQPMPEAPRTLAVDSITARALDGTYRGSTGTLTLIERNGTLLMDMGAERYSVRMLGDSLINDGRLGFDYIRLFPHGDMLRTRDQQFMRAPSAIPAESPAVFRDFIGEYGWDHNTLFVYEDNGILYTLIEWFFRYPLEEIAPDVYRFPDTGLYMQETLTFVRDATNRVVEANLAGVPFKRMDTAPGQGTFTIERQGSIDSLRTVAYAAEMPTEEGNFRASDLVDVTSVDSTIKLDIRYATDNNFMASTFYRVARAFLQRPAAMALKQASASLAEHGYGIIVYDGYRPWHVTKMFWDGTPESQRLFVANPANGSRHNRGCAVDVGLYDLVTGDIIEMPSGYDEFTARAYADYPGGTARSRYHRELLRNAMEEAGFTVYSAEWWHYDYKDWRSYPLGNTPIAELD